MQAATRSLSLSRSLSLGEAVVLQLLLCCSFGINAYQCTECGYKGVHDLHLSARRIIIVIVFAIQDA